jgi:hypothetical protein
MKSKMDHQTLGIEARLLPETSSSSAAPEPAPEAPAGVETIRLPRSAQERFASLLLDPPPPPDALLRALERHRTLIVE